MQKKIKNTLRYANNLRRNLLIDSKIRRRLTQQPPVTPETFNSGQLKTRILGFVNSLQMPGQAFQYRYSSSCNQPTLYASAYVCMTLSMLGDLASLNAVHRAEWAAYFDSFQSPEDGLFYDPILQNEIYAETDWWGARHLALHMISAYTDLGSKPQYPFYFLKYYYNLENIRKWLDAFDWNKAFSHANDVDNKIMNIGCLLQYQRDAWSDDRAGAAVAYLQQYLLERINPETGMWGQYDVSNPDQRSRMVQFAYHLFPLFFYDNIEVRQPDKIIDLVLATQNKVGGFGVKLNSSACEDIDSIDILVRLVRYSPCRQPEVDVALGKALRWVLSNQVEDGGFVFRLYEPFTYGVSEMHSNINQGSLFATWFRLLSVAYLSRFYSDNRFIINNAPGLEQYSYV